MGDGVAAALAVWAQLQPLLDYSPLRGKQGPNGDSGMALAPSALNGPHGHRQDGQEQLSGLEGQRFFLVSAAWLGKMRRWFKQLENVPTSNVRAEEQQEIMAAWPGPVDNSSLLDSAAQGVRLRARLVESFDYVAVGIGAWELMCQSFGVGQGCPLERGFARDGFSGEWQLEVYPITLFLCVIQDGMSIGWDSDQAELHNISRNMTLGGLFEELRKKICDSGVTASDRARQIRIHGRLYGADLEEIRVQQQAELAATSIGKCKWCNEKLEISLLVEVSDSDGSWPKNRYNRGKRPSPATSREEQVGRKRKGSTENKYYGQAQNYKTTANSVHTRSEGGQFAVAGVRGALAIPPPASAFAPIPGDKSRRVVPSGAPVSQRNDDNITQVLHNTGNSIGSVALGVCGLVNLGNTCFINAPLQCLNQAQLLIKWFIDEEKLKALIDTAAANKVAKAILPAYANLVRTQWSSQHSVVTPSGFFSRLRAVQPLLGDFRQHDAHELLILFINTLHEETNRLRKHPNSSQRSAIGAEGSVINAKNLVGGEEAAQFLMDTDMAIEQEQDLFGTSSSSMISPVNETNAFNRSFNNGTRSPMPVSSPGLSSITSGADEGSWSHRAFMAWQQWKQSNGSPVGQLMHGQYESRLQCEACGNVSSMFDAFSVLSLPIVRDSQGTVASATTLDDCLRHFTTQEVLDVGEQWICGRCQQYRCATKKITLIPNHMPELLILHLKRFDAKGDKIASLVRFPITDLDMSRYVSSECALRDPGAGDDANAVMDFENDRESMPGELNSDSLVYDLFACTKHIGSTLEGGHYVANVLCSDGTWRLMDDSTVTPLPCPPDGCDPQAYLLFYKKKAASSQMM